MSEIRKVLLVDDHSIIRFGTALLIKDIIPSVAILQATTFDEAIQKTSEEKPDLIVLDIGVPGGGGVEMVPVLKLRHQKAKVLIFSCYDEKVFGLRYIHAGADGYLSKNVHTDIFKIAFEKIIANEKYISDLLKDQYIHDLIHDRKTVANPLLALSNRELEVAGMLVKGMTTAAISTKLNLSLSTVSTYKSRIYEKLVVTNIIDLAGKINLHQLPASIFS